MGQARRLQRGEAYRRILRRIVDLAGLDPVAERIDQPRRRRIGGQPERELVLGRRRHGGPGLAADHHRGRLRRRSQRGVEHDPQRVLRRVAAQGIERLQAGHEVPGRRLRPQLAEDALRVLGGIEAEAAIERARRRAVGIDVPAAGAADRLEPLEHGEIEAGDAGHRLPSPHPSRESEELYPHSVQPAKFYRAVTSGHDARDIKFDDTRCALRQQRSLGLRPRDDSGCAPQKPCHPERSEGPLRQRVRAAKFLSS